MEAAGARARNPCAEAVSANRWRRFPNLLARHERLLSQAVGEQG